MMHAGLTLLSVDWVCSKNSLVTEKVKVMLKAGFTLTIWADKTDSVCFVDIRSYACLFPYIRSMRKYCDAEKIHLKGLADFHIFRHL